VVRVAKPLDRAHSAPPLREAGHTSAGTSEHRSVAHREPGRAAMSEEKPGAKKYDQVAMNSIWREHCMKERSLLTLNENFRLNPHALAVSPFASVGSPVGPRV